MCTAFKHIVVHLFRAFIWIRSAVMCCSNRLHTEAHTTFSCSGHAPTTFTQRYETHLMVVIYYLQYSRRSQYFGLRAVRVDCASCAFGNDVIEYLYISPLCVCSVSIRSVTAVNTWCVYVEASLRTTAYHFLHVEGWCLGVVFGW